MYNKVGGAENSLWELWNCLIDFDGITRFNFWHIEIQMTMKSNKKQIIKARVDYFLFFANWILEIFISLTALFVKYNESHFLSNDSTIEFRFMCLVAYYFITENNILESIEIKQGNNFSEMTTETVKILLIFLMFK